MHLPNLASHPGAEIAAICGRGRERAAELAARFGIPQLFDDYREMIACGGLEALVVAAPDDLHYPIVLAALDAGLHVLCEKPLALTLEQAREMLARAEAVGVIHMISLTYRWTPQHRHLRQLVAGGYLGRIYQAHFSYLSGHGRDGQYQWRFDGRRANGVLGDLGPHVIDLARACCGEITSVSARLDQVVQRLGAAPSNDTALLAVEFAGGAQGHIHLSAVAHLGERGQQQRTSLHGELGALEAEATFLGEQIQGARHDQQQFQTLPVPDELWGDADRADFFDLFRKQPAGARLFVDAILAGTQPAPNFHDGLKIQQVIEAALASHHEGRRVRLDE
jgi:predicted dehydrogenase